MPDYDLGKAHGRVVIDYEDTGSKQAQAEMKKLDSWGQKLVETFGRVRRELGLVDGQFGETGARMARTFAIITGGTAILLGLSRATGTFAGRLFQLRGGMAIFGALGIALGGLPRSVQGFPNVIKQIILLSSAITLFAGSTKLLNSVFVAIGRFAASTQIVQRLATAFPALTGMIAGLAKHIPSIRQVGEAVDGWSKPIHTVARLALGIGAMIAITRQGISVAFALTKQLAKIGVAALAIDAGVKVVAGLVAALKQMAGALGVLPGLFAVVGVSIAAVALGLKGFGEAMKNLDDTAKFEEAIKKLAPAAQETARQIRKLVPEFERLQRSVQQRLFEGMADSVRVLAERYLPVLSGGLSNIAGEVNGIVKEFVAFATTGKTVGDVNTILQLTAQWLNNLSNSIRPFLSGLMNILVVSVQAFTGMSNGMADAALNFEAWTARIREDGSLLNWINNGITGVRQFIGFLVSMGQIVSTIFAAFTGDGGNVLLTLNQAADSVRDFLRSAEGQQVLNQLVDNIQLLATVTREVLSVALEELGPVFIALRPFVEDLATSVGGTLIGALRILGPILQGIAQALSAMGPVLGPIVGFFLGLGIAGKALVFIFAPIVFGIQLLISTFAALKTAFTVIKIAWLALQFVFAVSPWTIIIAGIILLVTLIIMNWDKIKEYLIIAWNFIKDLAVKVWTAISDFFVGLWNDIVGIATSVWGKIKEYFQRFWPILLGIFTGGIGLIIGLIIKNWDSIVAFTSEIWNNIVNFLKGIWQSIVDATRFIWEPIVSIITSIFTIIYDIIRTYINLVLIVVIFVWESIRDATIAAWNFIVTALTAAWQWIVDTFHSIFDPVVAWFTGIWNSIKQFLLETWAFILTWAIGIWAEMVARFHAVIDPIVEWWSGIWNNIKNTVQAALDLVKNWIQEKIQSAVDFYRAKIDPLVQWWKGIWDNIKNTVSNGVQAVWDWVTGLPGRILSALGDLGSLLLGQGRKIIEGFLNGLKQKFEDVKNFVGGIADWIASHKGPISYDKVLLKPAGNAIMSGLLNSMVAMRPRIIGFLEGLTDDIAGGLNGAASKITDASASLSTSTNLGVLNQAATAMTSPATLSNMIQAPGTGVPATASAGAGSTTVVIEKLEVPINAHLDPTDPMEWKKAMGAIHEGIRNHENEMK